MLRNPRRWHSVASLVSATIAAHALAARVQASERLLVPAYFDPTGDTLSDWTELTNAAAAGAPITVIMNPDSGPGNKAMADYTTAISAFQAAGGKIVGYVPTDYDADAASTVETQISDYHTWYPTINGIFLDEMAGDGTSSELSYYGGLYSYIKGLSSSLQVIGNPGENVAKGYAAVADTLVTYENPNAGYAAQQSEHWTASEPASLFANIVYEVPNVATMQADLTEAESQNAGYVYFTDDGADGNPYNSLPSYFQAEVSAVPEPVAAALGMTAVAAGLLRRSRRASRV
jgi:hypothetical protein